MLHHDRNKTVKVVHQGSGGFILLLAYIGAAIYFVQQSNGSFWDVIHALLQAIVWPVYVMFHVLQLLGA